MESRCYHGAMRSFFVCVVVLALAATAEAQTSTSELPGKRWERTTPEAAGWDLERTEKVNDYLNEIGVTSYMLIQHGLVVEQGGDVAARTELHSCRKSFLSALIGIAANKQIHLTDTLAKLGIDDNPPSLTAEEKQATVRDLLEARSGVYHAAAYETKGMAEKRPERGSHPHGTFWYYNNWDFNALGGIYEKATHQSIYDALAAEIAVPIGMQDYRPKDGKYVKEASSRFPAYTIRMSARDLARFAMLYLHGGNWNGTQVVPAGWVTASVHPYSDTGSGGYGYLWWTADSPAPGSKAKYPFPPGSYWLEGHLGQFAVVVPSLDLIVVTRVDSEQTDTTVGKAKVSKLMKYVVAAAPQLAK
jgi:CubicO group peptidase (beta-lactamase class C family)